jgi:hypothetical protein
LCEQLNLKSIILREEFNYGKFKDEITLKFTSKSKEKRSLWSCFIVSTKQRFSWASRLKLPRRRYRV